MEGCCRSSLLGASKFKSSWSIVFSMNCSSDFDCLHSSWCKVQSAKCKRLDTKHDTVLWHGYNCITSQGFTHSIHIVILSSNFESGFISSHSDLLLSSYILIMCSDYTICSSSSARFTPWVTDLLNGSNFDFVSVRLRSFFREMILGSSLISLGDRIYHHFQTVIIFIADSFGKLALI